MLPNPSGSTAKCHPNATVIHADISVLFRRETLSRVLFLYQQFFSLRMCPISLYSTLFCSINSACLCVHTVAQCTVNRMMYLFDCKREMQQLSEKGLNVLKLASTPVFELCSTVTVNSQHDLMAICNYFTSWQIGGQFV